MYTLRLQHKEKANLEENYQIDTSGIFAFCIFFSPLPQTVPGSLRNYTRNNKADSHLNC